MERPAGTLEPEPEPRAPLASRLPVSFQYLHVQLAGGAPWGFTLRGGLEHGEPLIVSKVEGGGKAALSQKMRSGDELVNINGTPLYGSRQEALVLIKGSYRTLKMITRRRSVPIIRPHSWHLAKLSAVPAVGATMAFPADPPSLSWHLGCEMSDLPLPWNPLPPHCTTEQSGSPGSMESLGPAGQSYYEGGLSPADQAMDRGKRDSAYSSFSASSSTSDSALRPEETGPLDGAQPSQLPEPRYLQTGGETTDLPSVASGARFAASVPSGSLPSSAKAAAAPPQPPVRQDSLRVCGSPPHADSLCPEDRWRSDTALCMAGRDAHGPGGQLATTGPPKDAPLPYQYYLLSSQTEPPPGMKKGPPGPHCSLAESPGHPPGGPPEGKEQQAGPDSLPKSPASWEGGWAGPFGHRHSVPENLLVAQLRALDASRGQGEPRWTVSPLHREPEGLGAQDPWLLPDCGGQAEELDSPPAAREGPPSARGTCVALGRPQSTLGAQTGSPLLPAFDRASSPLPGFQAAPALGHLPDPEGSPPAAQKDQHRPAHIRRRSDRFATNLRNEIQWRRAQLQKPHGPGGLGCGEEPPTPEPENPPAKAAALAPPAPLGDGKPRGSSGLPAVAPKRWGSELSVFGEGRATCSPQSPPAPAGGWGGGRWRWSPEHKLQPQQLEPRPCPPPPLEEPGLLPFADRRKFFEETSRPATARPCGPPQGKLGPDAERPGSPEHGDLRHPSLDRPCRGPALLPLYQEFPPELLGVGKAPAWPGTEAERWWPLPCSCALREACACSGFRDECTMLHARSMPVPTCHCAHHCHPCSWSCCSERCCPTQQKLREDGGPWQARKPFQVERPPDEWEPPAVSRASIQALSQLLQHTGPFARASPCQTCFEHTELAWPPACRAASTHGLPWDCEQPRRVLGKGGPGGGPGEPPLRERAYSESHLCTGPAGVSVREEREAPSEEAGPTSPPYQARRRAPPPPRPPPPKWEKCRPAWALHQQPLPAPPGPPARGEGSRVPGQPASEAARQRSRSLPAEQLSHNWPPLQARLPPCAGSGGASSLSEQDGPHRYRHGSPAWSLELLSAQSAPSRVASPLEGAAAEEQETSSGSPSEQLPARRHQQGVPLSQDATGGSRKSGPPPSRLNSEELMRDVAGKDHSLAGVLGSGLGLRSAAEVMSDLFAASRCPLRPGQDWSPLVSGVRGPERQRESPEAATARGAPGVPPGLTYLNLSAGKAELLDKTKGQPEPPAAASEEELDHDLAQKKVQLIESLSQKLAVLQEAQQSLQDDLRANGALGREVEGHIKGACKPHELEKFRLVVGDLEKVVNLLLSLSGRLARVENALGGLNAEEEEEEEEKMALLEKKRQLIAQLEDAKELQEHVAQREQLVFASVSHCLPPEQLEDYQHFLRMKSTLAIQQRQLDDKIKLGKEQLHCLWESLPRRPREH